MNPHDQRPPSAAQAQANPALSPAKGAVELGCWSSRGVYGDNTCAELKAFVHCRNCPVYSGTAEEVLDGPLPPGYREAWTRHFALPSIPREFANGTVILFRVTPEWLAVPTRCLQEISDHRPVHSIPHHRQFILGLANVRGELLTCISLAHFLGLAPLPDRRTLRRNYYRLLVVNWNASRLCFPVNEISGPRRFSQEEFKPVNAPLSRVSAGLTNCVLRGEQKAVGLLDAGVLCSSVNRSLA